MSDGMEEIIADFVTEAEEALERIDPLFVELEAKGGDKELLDEIFRSMHTLKGAAGFLGLQQIVDVAHRSEAIMKKLRDGEVGISAPLMTAVLGSVDMLKVLLGHVRAHDDVQEDIAPVLKCLEEALEAAGPGGNGNGNGSGDADARAEAANGADPQEGAVQRGAQSPDAQMQTLRVDVAKIDKVMDLTGEIVLVRNRLLNIASSLDDKYSGDLQVDNLQEAVSFLDLVTSDIQLAVMKMRMLPIKKVFGKFPRLVRDMSRSLGKDVELVISGEHTEVDRSVIERIGDPMVHIIRNAMDHGIETAEKRLKKGKPAKGKIEISAYQKGNQIVVEVVDDGKGIDIERVKAKALEKGIVSDEEVVKMSDKEAAALIFRPGFTTMESATELSGRGVGMDVVKTNIAKLNGYVEIFTNRDIGSTFRISIPLTLAIIQALMVRSGGVQYAIPLAPIEETIKITQEDVGDVSGNRVIPIRDTVYPIAELTGLLGSGGSNGQGSRYVLLMAIGEKRFCIAVDELLGQEEVVIKTIDGIETDDTGILGATITGDGRIVLILDPAGIATTLAMAPAA